MRYANWIVATVAGMCLSLAGSSIAQIPARYKGEDPDFPLSKAFGIPEDVDAPKSKDTNAGTSKYGGIMLRGSQMLGMPIRNVDGQSVGKVVDVVGDPSGQCQFTVVSLTGDDRMIVLPFNGLQFRAGSRGENYALLRIAPSQLKNAPSFVGDEWPTFSPSYSSWVTEYYLDLVPVPGTTIQGSGIPATGRNHDQAEPPVSKASSLYPNPTPSRSVYGTPGTAAGATPSGAAAPGAPGNTSGAPAPGGSGGAASGSGSSGS